METTRSEQLFKKAVDLIPGGVNSPVRAFGNVGMTPRFIASANGVYLTDADGNKYLDYVGSWGPMILGHTREDVLEKVFEACKKGLSFGAATEAEVEMAELICSMVPSIEMVRMVNSGTEAVMSAIRAARGYHGVQGVAHAGDILLEVIDDRRCAGDGVPAQMGRGRMG